MIELLFEHKSESTDAEGRQMTILDTPEFQAYSVVRPGAGTRHAPRRSPSSRPGGAPLRYRGGGVLMSRASHRRRPITPTTTAVLALIAIHEEDPTANLLAPIVINLQSRAAAQCIDPEMRYSHRHALASAVETAS